ncbi:YfiR family protein [Xylophilus sp. GW821-FHT01B05]
MSWLILAFSLGLGAQAQTLPAVPEYTMKAAYLYNFALLTAWPAASSSAAEPFRLCLYGQDEFGPALDVLNGKDVNGQTVRVLRIDRAEDALQCRLIFIGETDARRTARLAAVLGRAPILTVTDADVARSIGAVISLRPEDRRLSFEVNASAARQANLQLSSKLLRLAARVVSP